VFLLAYPAPYHPSRSFVTLKRLLNLPETQFPFARRPLLTAYWPTCLLDESTRIWHCGVIAFRTICLRRSECIFADAALGATGIGFIHCESLFGEAEAPGSETKSKGRVPRHEMLSPARFRVAKRRSESGGAVAPPASSDGGARRELDPAQMPVESSPPWCKPLRKVLSGWKGLLPARETPGGLPLSTSGFVTASGRAAPSIGKRGNGRATVSGSLRGTSFPHRQASGCQPRSWWHNSATGLNIALRTVPLGHVESTPPPPACRLTSTHNRPGVGGRLTPGGVAGDRRSQGRPLSDSKSFSALTTSTPAAYWITLPSR